MFENHAEAPTLALPCWPVRSPPLKCCRGLHALRCRKVSRAMGGMAANRNGREGPEMSHCKPGPSARRLHASATTQIFQYLLSKECSLYHN